MQDTFAQRDSLVAADPTSTPDPGTVEAWIGDRAARIDPPGDEDPYILTSTYPLRVRDDSGDLRPLDFELVRDGEAYAPANVAEEVSLPAAATDYIQLPGIGVGIKLVSGEAKDAKTEVVTDEKDQAKKLFAHEVAHDTDALLTPSLAGAEQLLQLRGPEAPTSFSYAVSMAPDDQLRQVSPAQLEVIRNDDPVARITAPTAFDAQGTEVPVALKPTADGFELSVDHQGRDLAYPLLVDPGYDYVSTPSSWGYGRWVTEASPGAPYTAATCAYYCWGPGFYMGVAAGYFVPAGSYAQWHLIPPGTTTFIDEAFFEYVNFARGGDNAYATPYLYAGLYGARHWSDIYTWGVGTTNVSFDAFADSADRNGAYIGMGNSTARTLPAARGGDVGVVHLHLDDPDSPSVGAPSPPSGWRSSDQSFNVGVPATDLGLGVVAAFVYAPDDQQGQKAFGNFASGCGNNAGYEVCPLSTTVPVPVNPAHIPDGIQTLTAIATDAGGTSTGGFQGDPHAPKETTVKLDRKGPKITLSGELMTAAHGDLSAGTYPLNIAATDGTTNPSDPPPAHRSGVKNVQVYVDDHQQQFTSPDLSCPQDSCPLEVDTDAGTTGIQDWELNASELGGGTHTVTVVATDQVGNTTTKTIDLTINGLAGVILTPKSGDSTARLFELSAERHDPAMTDVTFQYRRLGWSSWQTIPTDQLTLDDDGSHPATTLLPLDQDGKSPPVTWEVPPTPGIDGTDGQINLRARFSTGMPIEQARDNAALYWRLGEPDDATALDSSGNGRSGTYVGGPNLNQQGARSGTTTTAPSS
jgi:hypothetical protein